MEKAIIQPAMTNKTFVSLTDFGLVCHLTDIQMIVVSYVGKWGPAPAPKTLCGGFLMPMDSILPPFSGESVTDGVHTKLMFLCM